MKSDLIDRVQAHCHNLAPTVVGALVARLEDDYLQRFDERTIARHLCALAGLSAEKPAAVLIESADEGRVECTILAFDHPFEFSSITGLMVATGFDIEQSEAFTLPRVRAGSNSFGPRSATRLSSSKSGGPPASGRDGAVRAASQASRLRHEQGHDPTRDAVIIDHFRGRLSGRMKDARKWSKQFEPAILEIIRLLDQRDEPSTDRAKRLVNERVTQWLKAQRDADRTAAGGLAAMDATIDQLPNATRLRLKAQDTPAFLYALGTALSLHGLQIERTRAQTLNGQAIDTIDVVDSRGKPLADPDRLQQLRLSVLLTQRFAYFLDRAPDPFTALQRFEELSERIVQTPKVQQWLDLLADPASMADLAKVLGASDYLWEDFIRSRADDVLPAIQRHVRGQNLCPPARSLPRRLDAALDGAGNFDEQRARLNEFKDRELFLIDLDHILGGADPDVAFQTLSERLVFLAENLVAAAAKLVHEELLRLYGQPRNDQKRKVGYAVFGLGKLGGVALGYASDIELLFLFDAPGRTKGGARGSLSNDEFFAILTRETRAYIQTKREGIFQIDLRLRPHGNAGPLAISRQQFADYYASTGPAHPFERLALVQLRWIAGDPGLGFAIEELRDRLIYDPAPAALDLDAIWEVWGKMRTQRLKGRSLNSKYSPGALTDLEGAIQLLQVMHAGTVPQLRTPRLHQAIQGLHRAAILSAEEFEQILAAYQFLRRLINAQRILRGSAQDLFLPPEESDELLHLARRMNYLAEDSTGKEAGLSADFKAHTQAVRKFIRQYFGRAVAGETSRPAIRVRPPTITASTTRSASTAETD